MQVHCIIGLIGTFGRTPVVFATITMCRNLTPDDYLGVTHTRVILSIHYVLDIRRNTPIGLKLREVSAQSDRVSPISRYDNT